MIMQATTKQAAKSTVCRTPALKEVHDIAVLLNDRRGFVSVREHAHSILVEADIRAQQDLRVFRSFSPPEDLLL